ncbi:N-acetylglucosamine-binding protein GbpA [Buttiauxella gaviniae]|uniref:N-acetylglucosamine-binding protein GbpA n=1 Tax=Buttiauxella gaviniae TaxID=82990 RepID=A0ABV3NTF1_9ENTR
MKLRNCVISSIILVSPIYSWAHGYISSPESRVYSCNLNHNSGCGSAQYEPQSLEATSGFPTSGPADGSLASAGHSNFSNMDEQTAGRWAKQPMSAGQHNFVWTHTAPHRTTNWRYYITKQDWSPNQPLSRAAFESKPFCQYEGNGQAPNATVTHSCNVPSRTGYQVIYGVWEIADTSNSFYQVIDVDFGGGSDVVVDQWSKQVGQIQPREDLNTGDKVIARLFNNTTELTSQNITWTVPNATQGKASNWGYNFASQINNTNNTLRAGVKDGAGNISPAYGDNNIYTAANSNLSRVEIEIQQQAPVNVNSFTLSNLNPNYDAARKTLNLKYDVAVKGSLDLTMSVFGSDNSQKAQQKASVTNKTVTYTLPVSNVSPGNYTLVVVAKDAAGTLSQQSQAFSLTDSAASGEYDYVFPQGLANYKAGTRVLQPKDKKVYQCRPLPYAGYCKQWSKSAFGYEPGYGFAWEQAWTLAK